MLPADLRETLVGDVLQDQISSAHPAAPLVVAPLLEAAGVLHVRPTLVVLPHDSRLPEFDCVRTGMLGTIEERPTDGADGRAGFAGARDVASTPKLLELLEPNPSHRVDSRAFLTARLMDLYVGDWDRHWDQWRWARFDDEAGAHWWQPIPRDRDQAFARFDGVIPWIARVYREELVGFRERYPRIFRLAWTGRALDRRFLTDLERPVWDSTARALQVRLSDPVIEAAVRQLPPEYFALNGDDLARALRSRRNQLPEAAAQFYALLAREVDVHASDKAELAEVERLAGGLVVVRLGRRSAEGDEPPYYERTFDPRETAEIRLYLHGGGDRAVVRGTAPGPVIRIVGGGGDDELIDSSSVEGTHFYDDRGENRLVRGPETDVDDRRYRAPPRNTGALAFLADSLPRDWGSRAVPLMSLSFTSDIGVFVGGGVTRTFYGFRQHPYRSRVTLRGGVAPGAGAYQAELMADFRGPVPGAALEFRLRASGIEALRFYGFGNETVAPAPDEFYRVRQEQYHVTSSLALPVSGAVRLAAGPELSVAHTEQGGGSFLDSVRPYGAGTFAQAGFRAGLEADTRDRPAAPARGVLLSLGGKFYPAVLDTKSAYAVLHGEAATYLTAATFPAATLALRTGATKVFGRPPFYDAAYLGGFATVRGLPEQRFAGDGAAYGNAELRVKLANTWFPVPGDFGVFALGDAGRVYWDGDDSDQWHTAMGGGLWLALLDRTSTLTLAVARSEERTRVYLRAGFSY